MNSLNLMLFNVENFFVPPYSIDRDYPIHSPKSHSKLFDIAKIIKKNDPHIIMLTEVGGADSLHNFNQLYLNNTYIESLIEGNSDRGIELGYLVKKDLPFYYEHYTHRNRPLNFQYDNEKSLTPAPVHYLSRDISELRIFKGEREKNKTPSMILLLVHLKSKLDSLFRDPQGSKRRQAEFKMLMNTYEHLSNRYSQKVPIILAGDFNGNASSINTDSEFTDIYKKTQLEDFMQLINIPTEERFSYIHFPEHYKASRQQLDYIFIPPNLKSHIDKKLSGAYRFLDNNDQLIPIPTNRSLQYSLPSDHYPLFLYLKNII